MKAKITAKSAGRGISKAIPLVSDIISGGLTFATSKPKAKRLHEALKKNHAFLASDEKAKLL